MIVQIYEIQTPEEAERCLELGVDHIGSVLHSVTDWRQSAIRDVMRLTRGTSSKNSLIPLFMDQDLLFSAMDYYRPHSVHFCESLTDSRGRIRDLAAVIGKQQAFKKRFPEIGIMRSIPVPARGVAPDFPSAEITRELETACDFFLIDTWLGQEPVEGYVGITGLAADWDRAATIVRQSSVPVILAGGLSAKNVYEALLKVRSAGADSCTQTNAVGPEGKPIRFKKDFDKVSAFVSEARRAGDEVESVKSEG